MVIADAAIFAAATACRPEESGSCAWPVEIATADDG
jgi:hypothetical protein